MNTIPAYAAPPAQAKRRIDAVQVLTFIIAGYTLGIFMPDYTTFMSQAEFIEAASASASTARTNIVNQLFWLAMTGVIGVVVLRARQLSALMAGVWPFLPVFAFALISVLWSADAGATLRRILLVGFAIFCFAGLLASAKDVRDVWRAIYAVAWVIAIQNLIALPMSTTWDYQGNFRGVYSDKNALGLHVALAMLIAVGAGSFKPAIDKARNRWLLYALLAGPLFFSMSKTSMAFMAFITTLAFINSVWNRTMSQRAKVAGVVLVFTPLSFIGFFLILNINSLMQALFSRFTFTGRTAIWDYLNTYIQQNVFLGSGYGAFWGIGAKSPNLSSPYAFIRHLNQAHNGYVDLQLQLGAIGMTLFVLSLAYSFFVLIAARVRNMPGALMSWLLIYFALMHNLMETTFWRGYSHVWGMFIFAVASLMIARYRERETYFRSQQIGSPLHTPAMSMR